MSRHGRLFVVFVLSKAFCQPGEPFETSVTAGLTLREDQRLTFVMVLLNNTGKEIVNKMEIDVPR